MKKSLIPFVLCAYFLASCGSHTNPKFISEGIIEYKATAVDPNNSMASLAPNKMIVKFKDNYTQAELTTGMGLFSMSFISDPNKKQFINLVKLLNQKFARLAAGDVILKEVDENPKPIVEKKPDTKIIAGYNCKHAHVTYADQAMMPFDIWYTNEINIKDPNWSNPYHELDGVLMEYQLKRYGLELRFTCTSVAKANIDESIFTLPSDYKIITRQELDKKFEGF